MLPLIFMGVEMLVLGNSSLKMYLLNTQLNFHIVIDLIISYSFYSCYLPRKNNLYEVYD